MSKQIGIYKIVSPSGRIYIGQSINIDKRENDYKKYSKFQGQKRLKSSVKKYGWEPHKFSIIELCFLENLNDRERYWQDYYNVLSYKGLNCKLTKSKDKSGELSVSMKSKISKSLMGNTHSEQRKLNQSKGQTGLKRTSIHKAAIGKALEKVVIQYTLDSVFIKEWESIKSIQDSLGYDNTCICRCCNSKQKSSYGYIWKFKII